MLAVVLMQVCLSLLGTWSGRAGENWNPEGSNILQVLISIQGLVLVDNPFFLEPVSTLPHAARRGDR